MFVQQEPSPLSAQGQVVRPGEDGTILLRVPTWLADLQLRSGRYEFHQRVDRGERFITVVEVKRYALFKLGVRDSRKLVAEVKCRLVAQGETATETGVHLRSEAGRLRVDWLILEGQDGRYFPESVRR
jgi:hypothetical protein